MDPTIDQQQWRDQVAAAVRSVKPITFGGTCWLRSALGAMALTHLGMRPRPVIGGAVFRSGPDPTLDAVNFCGSSNYAEWVNGNPLFHVWLDVNGDIVDSLRAIGTRMPTSSRPPPSSEITRRTACPASRGR